MRDAIKPILASIGGFSAQFTNIDLALKVLIGLATLYYVGLKIYGEHKRQRKEQ